MNWEKRNAYRILVEKPQGKRPLERPRCRWVYNTSILETWDRVVWTGSIWLRNGPVEGSCEHGNEPLGSIQCWKVLQ
jgi:hypothetical protein